jgi:hypothetical protein
MRQLCIKLFLSTCRVSSLIRPTVSEYQSNYSSYNEEHQTSHNSKIAKTRRISFDDLY